MAWLEGHVYPHDDLATKGHARFTTGWTRAHGTPPPIVLMERADGRNDASLILRTSIDDGADADIALSTQDFRFIAIPVEFTSSTHVRFRDVGFLERLNHPSKRKERNSIAQTLCLGFFLALGVLLNVFFAINEKTHPAIPLIALIVFSSALLAAIVKMRSDLRKLDES